MVTDTMPRSSWIILGLILVVQIVSPMGYYGLPALAPFILDDWGITRQQFGLLLSAFSTGTVLLAFPAGILTDRIGTRAILLAGQIGIGVTVAVAPWLAVYFWVLTVMFLAGMGYGLVNPAGSKAVYVWFPPRRRATALGLKQLSLPLCGVVSGLVLPPLALFLGWRMAWMIIGLAALGSMGLTALVYVDPSAADVPGVSDAALPASAMALLRHGNILRLSVAAFLFTGTQIAWHTYLATYLKECQGMTVVLAGTYIALMQSGAILGRPLLGMISDTLFGGTRRGLLILVGGVCSVLGLWFAVLPVAAPPWTIALVVGLFGITGVGWHGVHLSWMTELAGPRTAGAASGLWIGSSHLGIIVIVPLFGTLVDLTGTYTLGWLCMAVTEALAAIVLWRIR